MSSYRYWLVCHPDMQKPIGGIKQIHRLAEAIVASGRKATIIQDNEEFHPGWFSSDVETISYSQWMSLSHDRDTEYLIIPETFISVLDHYSKNLPCIIFNQNASYTFGMPGSANFIPVDKCLDLYLRPFVKHVLCVSLYDYNFISRHVLGATEKISLLVNGLEDSVFKPLLPKRRKIVYMPRKNSLDAKIVSSLIARHHGLARWSVVSIDGLPHEYVLDHLRSSLIFLSFGHPEGFGLPVAEAMASGCGVIGYSGLGGRELFDLGKRFSTAEEISFGDWGGFISALLDFENSLTCHRDDILNRLFLASKEMASRYNMQLMRQSVVQALNTIENGS